MEKDKNLKERNYLKELENSKFYGFNKFSLNFKNRFLEE
jgi:hypothetical protein